MKAVVLVPRRNDNGPRDALWTWCKAWWQANLPELPIFEGHHDEGLFNRSAAVNRAAQAAGDWDVAVIIDSDVICDPEHVREAVELAGDFGDRLVLPFDRRHNLNPRGSQAIMAGEQGSWRAFIGRTYHEMCSSCVMIPRSLWDEVGGFDEQFEGWGFEDSAFSLACETFGGHTTHKIEGELWHFWHPTAPEGRRGTPSYQANRHRKELYAKALGNKTATRRLITGKSWSPAEVRRSERIPRILHRTVPAHTTDQVESWWESFGELHADWQLMTHRDPLDPADWPLTSSRWADCTSGAQMAGLIRLEALYRWGGVYVDSDCEPYRSLEPLLPLHAFAAWEDAQVVPDAVIGAEPEHPAIKACLDLALERVPLGAWESGPGVLTEVLPGRDDVLLLPPGSLYPYHYRAKRLRDRDHASEQPWAFMAHHWAGSWLEQKTA